MKEIMEEYSTTFFECMSAWPDDIKEDIYKLYAYSEYVMKWLKVKKKYMTSNNGGKS